MNQELKPTKFIPWKGGCSYQNNLECCFVEVDEDCVKISLRNEAGIIEKSMFIYRDIKIDTDKCNTKTPVSIVPLAVYLLMVVILLC